jgi:hypothetical protein
MVVDMGLVGLALLVIFIMTTLHAIGRVADRDPARAWVLLSLAIFIILHNLLESSWMGGADFIWVMFVLVAAEIAGDFISLHGRIRSRASRLASRGPLTRYTEAYRVQRAVDR